MTDYALQELEKKLTDHPFHGVMKLSVTICKDISNIQPGIPLIVICLSSSRLSVDLRNAIFGVRTGSSTAVLIFHHLKEHALPTEPSHTILTKDEVSNVGTIIDVAFFETMGIYKCDMNIKAFSTLITFILDNYKE
ncbi:hypothetical protein ACJMK2_029900 [Sinanodonta woodiana]|uniref:Uncharacterized protein n=1 Tax=Sinanodonta woodiana TaxID=1069815 RepID=A0ABD3XFI2_SINWO